MRLYLSSHGVMSSDMVGVSLLLCTQKEAVRVLEMKQEMPSLLLVINVTVLTQTYMYDDLCFYCTKPLQSYLYGLTLFLMQLQLGSRFTF